MQGVIFSLYVDYEYRSFFRGEKHIQYASKIVPIANVTFYLSAKFYSGNSWRNLTRTPILRKKKRDFLSNTNQNNFQ